MEEKVRQAIAAALAKAGVEDVSFSVERPSDLAHGDYATNAAMAAAKAGKKLQVRLGSSTGTIIGTLTIAATGGLTTFKPQRIAIAKVTGVHDVFLTFAAAGTANLQSFKFA